MKLGKDTLAAQVGKCDETVEADLTKSVVVNDATGNSPV